MAITTVLLILLVPILQGVHSKPMSPLCPECCPPGTFMSSLVNVKELRSRCEPCEEGTFPDSKNVLSTCKPCTKCESGTYEVDSCSATSDTVCLSCSHAPKAVHQSAFLGSCGGENVPFDGMFGDQPSDPDDTSTSPDLKEDDESDKTIQSNSTDTQQEPDEDEDDPTATDDDSINDFDDPNEDFEEDTDASEKEIITDENTNDPEIENKDDESPQNVVESNSDQGAPNDFASDESNEDGFVDLQKNDDNSEYRDSGEINTSGSNLSIFSNNSSLENTTSERSTLSGDDQSPANHSLSSDDNANKDTPQTSGKTGHDSPADISTDTINIDVKSPKDDMKLDNLRQKMPGQGEDSLHAGDDETPGTTNNETNSSTNFNVSNDTFSVVSPSELNNETETIPSRVKSEESKDPHDEDDVNESPDMNLGDIEDAPDASTVGNEDLPVAEHPDSEENLLTQKREDDDSNEDKGTTDQGEAEDATDGTGPISSADQDSEDEGAVLGKVLNAPLVQNQTTENILTLEEAEAKYKETHPGNEAEQVQDRGAADGHTSDHDHDHDKDSDHDHEGVKHGKSHHDDPEDKENKKRTAIIVGVALGGVTLFTLAFFGSRHCSRKKQFKAMKKVSNDGGDDAIEFRPVNQSDTALYSGGNSSNNGLYRMGPKMGPPSPRFHRKNEGKFEFPDIFTSPEKETPKKETPKSQSQPALETFSASEPLMNSKDPIKYIDESTDDEYVNSYRERLLPSQTHDPKLGQVSEETFPTTSGDPGTNEIADKDQSDTDLGFNTV